MPPQAGSTSLQLLHRRRERRIPFSSAAGPSASPNASQRQQLLSSSSLHLLPAEPARAPPPAGSRLPHLPPRTRGGAVPPTPRGARTQHVRSPCSILLFVVIFIILFLARSSSRNRELGKRCSSDADCMSGLSCYNWNGFTGKKCVRTTIANPFNTVVILLTGHWLRAWANLQKLDQKESMLAGSDRLELGDRCSSDADCVSGLSCYNWNGFTGKKCVRTTTANPFNTVGTSLPFNKYAFLTTHNSFSITGVTRFTFYNQEDSVTDQLNNGVRALMLDVYDLRDDIWLCHSFGGKCFYPNAFEPAIYTMREIEAFLLTNPSDIVTLILEDHVTSHHGLSKLFNKTGLMKYWFPVSRMPRDGEDWPRVSDMIKLNHRLLVFTSNRLKELSEEIAYQWNYMVENQYGGGGMDSDVCYNRPESSVLSDRTKSLVLVNYFRTIPLQRTACMEHSRGLVDVLNTCYAAAGNRWANFLAVDYYKRSDGGGVFQAIDMLNGMLICGRNDVRACRKLTLKGALYDLLYKLGLVWKASPMH